MSKSLFNREIASGEETISPLTGREECAEQPAALPRDRVLAWSQFDVSGGDG